MRYQLTKLESQLLTALKEAHEENKLTEEAIGGCDHDAGICSCTFGEMLGRHADLIKWIEGGEK